jgi:hypothetical protein
LFLRVGSVEAKRRRRLIRQTRARQSNDRVASSSKYVRDARIIEIRHTFRGMRELA